MQKRKKNYSTQSFVVNAKSQCTDEFGGYSKSWLAKNKEMSLCSQDSYMSDEYGIESISQLIGLDIEQKARDIIMKKSPNCRRQIAKPVQQIPLQSFKMPTKISTKLIRPSPLKKQSKTFTLTPQSKVVDVECLEEIRASKVDEEIQQIQETYDQRMNEFYFSSSKKEESKGVSLEQSESLISPLKSEDSHNSQVSFGQGINTNQSTNNTLIINEKITSTTTIKRTL